MEKVKPNFKGQKPRYFFKEWRKFRGLTQEELASRVNLSVASISQLERGKQGFTDSTLEAFADALGCSPGDLLMRNPLDKNAPWSLQERLAKADASIVKQIIDFTNFLLKDGTRG